LREALAGDGQAELPAARTAAALRALGEAAEAAGDDATALEAFGRLAARYGDDPSASGVAYRVARLTAGASDGRAAKAAYADAERSRDALERRVAAAGRAYEAIVAPFEGPQKE
jgi:hypothetical protein